MTSKSSLFTLMRTRLLPAVLVFSVAAVFAERPTLALDLLSAGWSHPAACNPEGSPAVLYGCYEDLTGSSITLYGQDSSTPPSSTSTSYTLSASDQQLAITFNASFNPDGNGDSEAFYKLGTSARVLFARDTSLASYALTLSPGEQLLFSINQNNDAKPAGFLAITSFQASPAAVPFPLPILGPLGLAMGACRLRRSARALAAARENQQR